MPDLEDAILLAVQAHKGKIDKAGRPYILHLLRVMAAMQTDIEMITAVLHDVIEDTPCSLADLRSLGYPDFILTALDALTARNGESYDAFVRRVLPNAIARRVKIADLNDNLDVRRLGPLVARDLDRLNKYKRALLQLMAEEQRLIT